MVKLMNSNEEVAAASMDLRRARVATTLRPQASARDLREIAASCVRRYKAASRFSPRVIRREPVIVRSAA